MPACFSLTPIDGAEPANLADVDRLICAAFGWRCDEKHYVMDWYDIIGFRLACGLSFTEVMEDVADENDARLWKIAEWLEKNYTSRNWYSRY